MKIDLDRYFNKLYFLLWHISFYVLVFMESRLIHTFAYWPLRILLYGITLASGVLCIYRCLPLWKSHKPLFICLTALALLLLSSILFKGGSIIPLLLICLIILSRGIPLSKLFLSAIKDLCISTILIVFLSLMGVLQDGVDFRHVGGFFPGDYVRHSMGFLVHNQIPITFWTILLLYFVYKQEAVPSKLLLVLAFINQVIFHFFGSRIVYGLTLLLLIAYAAVRAADFRFGDRWHRWVYPLGGLAIIGCSCFSWLMAIVYDPSNSFLVRLDLILNNRFRLGNEALQKYAISFLGHGSDAALYPLDTFTVDNGYLITLIQQGLPFFLFLLFCYGFLVAITEHRNNIYLLLVICFLSVECVINAHLFVFKLLPLYCILANHADPLLTARQPAQLLPPGAKEKLRAHLKRIKPV